jgi:hypothetical protein
MGKLKPKEEAFYTLFNDAVSLINGGMEGSGSGLLHRTLQICLEG